MSSSRWLVLIASCSAARLLPRPTVRVPRAAQPLALAGRDFGASSPPAAPALDDDAAALLDEAGGDINRARTNYIGYTLAYLEDADPEMYEAIKTDPQRPDCHEALVEVTWDVIAAFLPVTHSPTPTPAASQKLTAIARAAVDGSLKAPRVLDVGCGNGLLLPFLGASGMPGSAYRGVDLSSRMIEVAKRVHAGAGARFDAVSFATVCGEAAEAAKEAAAGEAVCGEALKGYDAIVFNGALQFFVDPAETLASAAALLEPGEYSRIVLAHLNGASFVRKEAEDNPTTVRSTMPSLSALEVTATSLGLQVVLPSFYGSEVAEIEKGLDDFYLVVLRWDAEHGGVDGGVVPVED